MRSFSKEKIYWFSSCILSLMVGFLIFISIYGVKILNPSYADWILVQNNDFVLNYIGWIFYRNSDFSFPLGLFDGLSYPVKTLVMNMDAIPIFALFFKCFSKILPENFQYFGIYGLFCFMMQSLLGMIICKKFLDKNAYGNLTAVISGALFVLMPCVFLTLYWHSSSAAVWLILLALIPIFYYSELQQKTKVLLYTLLAFLTVGINVYFVVMGFIITFGYLCYGFFLKDYKNSIVVFLAHFFSSLVTAYIYGYFFQNVVFYSEDLYSQVLQNAFNLNGFINSFGLSTIMPSFNVYEDMSVIGFGYLGVGIILLIIIALFSIFKKGDFIDKKLLFSIIILVLLSLFFALSPRIVLGEYVLFNIDIPVFFKKFWAIFRCTGRFIWIMDYILLICALICIFKKLNKKAALFFIVLCTIIQFYEIKTFNRYFSYVYSQPQKYESCIKSELWTEISKNENIKVIYTEPSLQYYAEKVTRYASVIQYALALYANDYNIQLSDFCFARRNLGADVRYKNKIENPDDSDLFFFVEEFCDKEQMKKSGLNYFYKIDGYYVGSLNPLKGLENVEVKKESI